MHNVVLLVWDACRFGVAIEEATTLRDLGEENVWFENAIAPADYSHPSHASIFTGEYPHEHGCCATRDPTPNLSLVEHLDERGYTTYGVSGNLFIGPEFGFDEPFDWFESTFPFAIGNPWFDDGLDVEAIARESSHDAAWRRYLRYFGRAVTHRHPVRSLGNLGISAARKIAHGRDRLETRSPLLHSNNLFAYDPEDNTRSIEAIIEREAGTSSPFFLFSNYVDTHRPYIPPKRYQRQVLGETVSFAENARLNEEVAQEWSFLDKVHGGTLDEADVERVRQLYRAEARSVDAHLQRILHTLDTHGLREETLVIVTADHGENLGEADERGERRMGHMESVSDTLLNVPLVIAHPELDPVTVDRHATLTYLADVCRNVESFLDSRAPAETLVPADEYVMAQCPATYEADDTEEAFPNVPSEIVHRQAFVDRVVGFAEDWKLVLDSDGAEWAWQDGAVRDVADAPPALVDQCHSSLETLTEQEKSGQGSLKRATRSRLENLGYL